MTNNRNDMCVCGSNKKVKKCYAVDINQNTCSVRLKETYNQNIEPINKYILKSIIETKLSIQMLSSNIYTLTSQFILLVSSINFLGYVWKDFISSNEESDGKIFEDWYDKFFAVESNKYWYKNKYIQRITGKSLYKMRSNLIHSRSIHEEGIVLVNAFDQKRFDEIYMMPRDIIIPIDFIEGITEGVVLMSQRMSIEPDSMDTLLGIRNITKRFCKKAYSIHIKDNKIVNDILIDPM